jgi:hypothetical protein
MIKVRVALGVHDQFAWVAGNHVPMMARACLPSNAREAACVASGMRRAKAGRGHQVCFQHDIILSRAIKPNNTLADLATLSAISAMTGE